MFKTIMQYSFEIYNIKYPITWDVNVEVMIIDSNNAKLNVLT